MPRDTPGAGEGDVISLALLEHRGAGDLGDKPERADAMTTLGSRRWYTSLPKFVPSPSSGKTAYLMASRYSSAMAITKFGMLERKMPMPTAILSTSPPRRAAAMRAQRDADGQRQDQPRWR